MDNDLIASYVDSGWSILPVKPEEKRPYMSNWLQYTRTRASKEMALNWFNTLSRAGVGVVTGKISNIVVLDVESWCKVPIEELLKK